MRSAIARSVAPLELSVRLHRAARLADEHRLVLIDSRRQALRLIADARRFCDEAALACETARELRRVAKARRAPAAF